MFKFHLFHNWSNWVVDSDREIEIYSCEESFNNFPSYTLRKIVQKRTCLYCNLVQYKSIEIKK